MICTSRDFYTRRERKGRNDVVLDRNRNGIPNGFHMSLRNAVFPLKFQGSCGIHIVDHLTADGACLTGGEIPIVALIQRDADLGCCLHLELLKSLLGFGNECLIACHNCESPFCVFAQGANTRRDLYSSSPQSESRSQTILGSVRLNGQTTHTVYPGGTTAKRFIEYLKNVLIPTLHKGDIVVMDNMRSHHVGEVAEVLRAAGIELLYLPPYSPDMNPIEMMWSKLKALLRKWECRNAGLLPETVSNAFANVTRQDCEGGLKRTGIARNFGECYKI